jgi:phosphatidate cytidylyltransferase
MLAKRLLTAAILVLVLVVELSIEPKWPLLSFISLAVGIAAYEWLRLTMPSQRPVAIVVGLAMLILTLALGWQWQIDPAGFRLFFYACVIASALMWLFVIPAYMYRGPKLDRPLIGWAFFAPICLFATWGVLADLWISSGAWPLISLLVVVWIADIFAYFGGRQFGRHKLAPTISPGKTREGALIGLAGVLVWMLASSQWSDSFAAQVLAHWGWVGLTVSALVLGSVSVLGDLFESLLKRCAGVKDSGRLLPGHGGVYDRVDAVVAVVPVAYLLINDFWY